ncbi:hypothetical protein EG329_009599 [Mollisiaceae sp. DMI_Dod_QoI]|nr:hypothetical protein EG329_009599 [Helotiales sp. DMI_Dod_QoI]
MDVHAIIATTKTEQSNTPSKSSIHYLQLLPAELRVMIYQIIFRNQEQYEPGALKDMVNFLLCLKLNPKLFGEACYEFIQNATIHLSFESCHETLKLLLHDEYTDIWDALPVMPKLKLVPNAYVHPSRLQLLRGRKQMNKFTELMSKVRHLTIDFISYPEYHFDNQGYLIWDFHRFQNLTTFKIVFPITHVTFGLLDQSRLEDAIEKANQRLGVLGKLCRVQQFNELGSFNARQLHDLRVKQRAVDGVLTRNYLPSWSWTGPLRLCKLYPQRWLADLNLPWWELNKWDPFDNEIRQRILRTEEWFWRADGEGDFGQPPKNFL